MKQKDLAKEYAKERLVSFLDLGVGFSFEGKTVFTAEDIENAFNAGRGSVIEEASKLEWKEVGLYSDFGLTFNVCEVDKPLGNFSIRKSYISKDIELLNNGFLVRGGFKSIEEAKSYASKVYEERIKKYWSMNNKLLSYVARLYEKNLYLEMQNKVLESRCHRLERDNRVLLNRTTK